MQSKPTYLTSPYSTPVQLPKATAKIIHSPSISLSHPFASRPTLCHCQSHQLSKPAIQQPLTNPSSHQSFRQPLPKPFRQTFAKAIHPQPSAKAIYSQAIAEAIHKPAICQSHLHASHFASLDRTAHSRVIESPDRKRQTVPSAHPAFQHFNTTNGPTHLTEPYQDLTPFLRLSRYA